MCIAVPYCLILNILISLKKKQTEVHWQIMKFNLIKTFEEVLSIQEKIKSFIEYGVIL